MKIVVYAITKNEIGFVDRWYESMKEADEIYVMDTGSTDGTAERMESLGIHVNRRKIVPWRFDTARNASLEFVPDDADVLVCTDIDEVFSEPGWRKKLEDAWTESARNGRVPTHAVYTYVHSFFENGDPDGVYAYRKIHVPKVFHWHRMLHEYVEADPGVKSCEVVVPGLVLEHRTVDKDDRRSSQFDLCRKWVSVEPYNPDAHMYMAHYMRIDGDIPGSTAELNRALDLLSRVIRFPVNKMAEIYECLAFNASLEQDLDRAETLLLRAFYLNSKRRSVGLLLAEMYLDQRRWVEAAMMANETMKRQKDGFLLSSDDMSTPQTADVFSVRLPYIRFIGFANAKWRKEADECLTALKKDFPNESCVAEAEAAYASAIASGTLGDVQWTNKFDPSSNPKVC